MRVDLIRVFTDKDGRHGNPLGIADQAEVAETGRQALAAELGYSETVFVDIPTTSGADVDVRIHTPAMELPFAGHPTVGTAAWLASRRTPASRLVVPAGKVEVRTEAAITWIRGRAEWAPEFEFHEMKTPQDVLDADPATFTSGSHYLWAWQHEGEVRSRMFSPAMGVREDEATGAAAVRLTELLGRDLVITQGLGSQIFTRNLGDGWIELGGRVELQPDGDWTSKPQLALRYSAGILKGSKVALRALEESDYGALEQWWFDPEHSILQHDLILPRPKHTVSDQFALWSKNEGASSVGFAITSVLSHDLVGHVTLWGAEPRNRTATLAIVIGKPFTDKGYGTDALRTILRYGFHELGLHRIELRTAAFNARGIHTYTKVGFTEEGRRRAVAFHGGQWHDELIMGILESEFRPS